MSRFRLETHDPTKPRVYCPTCGEVRGSLHYVRHRGTGTGTVHTHHRNTGEAAHVLCPGGPIDLEKDTAT